MLKWYWIWLLRKFPEGSWLRTFGMRLLFSADFLVFEHFLLSNFLLFLLFSAYFYHSYPISCCFSSFYICGLSHPWIRAKIHHPFWVFSVLGVYQRRLGQNSINIKELPAKSMFLDKLLYQDNKMHEFKHSNRYIKDFVQLWKMFSKIGR